MQTKFGPHGNCLMACIASILEVPMDPDFEMGDNWWQRCWDFSESLGQRIACISATAEGIAPSGYTIATGDGPRGYLHCVVVQDGRIVHDPHPAGGGIANVRDFIYFVPLCKTDLPLRRHVHTEV